MPLQPDAFRDFGILPQDGPPPPEKVRSYLSRGRVIGQYIGSGVVASAGVGLAVVLGVFMPFPLNVLGAMAALAGFGAFVYLATHNDYRWVELDGNTLRAQHLYTGRVIERSLEEINSLVTMVLPYRRLETVVIESFFGRVKGIEIRFRDRRTPLRVMRYDPAMANARELIEAIVFRMAQLRELDAEVFNFAGKPLVRHIQWKSEKPLPQARKTLKVCLICFILMALMFGPILGMIARLDQRRLALTSVPPQEIALQTLIDNGPGTNPHMVLTNFQFGNYVIETENNSWTSVWIALFPIDNAGRVPATQADEQKEIKVVLQAHTIRNDTALQQFLQQKQVAGLCSDHQSLSGGTLRTELLKANPGSSLSSAWVIDELSDPPSATTVRGNLLGSAACYALAFALAVVVFTLRS